MDVEKKVREYIKKQNLIERNDRVLLGLSGGADSVCLFHLLLGLREELGFSLRAAHIHHGIRAEAEEDAAYVGELCAKEGIFCYFYREDVPAYGKEQGLGEEEAGRLLRYRDFEESLRLWQEESEDFGETDREAADCRGCKIAVAHHMNDQAETVLFRLFRGCGLAGLRGMLPRRGRIIRPLLCLSRAEIEEYLQKGGISWREDRTNLAEEYNRNKIRHKILSYAEREINGEAPAHIARTAEILREAEDYIKRQVEQAFQRTAAQEEGCVAFDLLSLEREDVFLQKQLLLYGLERLLAARKDVGAVHIEEILTLAEKQGNGELFLPGGVRVRKSYGELYLFREKLPMCAEEKACFLYGEKAPVPETEKIDLAEEDAVKKRFGIREISEILHCIPQKTYTKWFDYDKINMPFSVRHPENGDYLTINEKMERKNLRRYMIEQKIPVCGRNSLWLLADGSHVMWVPGGRMSAYYKVTEKTKVILQVKICKEA